MPTNPAGKSGQTGHAALAFTTRNFKEEVLSSATPVLVDFTASWCGPCQRLAPVIESLAVKYAGRAKVGKVDVDDNQDLAMEYGVTSVPTILFFKDGELKDTVMGYNPESTFSGKLEDLIGR
jgi:thioredoxin 1